MSPLLYSTALRYYLRLHGDTSEDTSLWGSITGSRLGRLVGWDHR
jgi:hypothetical protein